MTGAAAPEGPRWSELLTALLAGQDLPREHTAWVMEQLMAGAATPAQLAGFLVALRAKGETVAELTGLVEVMLRHALPIEVSLPAVDVVGTGGDRHGTVNISTMAALVVAGTGRRVVKHGNRAASSRAGTADVFEALGVPLDLPPARVAALAEEVGIAFCFAQTFHPAFRHAGPVRRELGIPTLFNALGPLANPARPGAAAVGVADLRLLPLVAGVLAERGDRAVVSRSEDGLDELGTTAAAEVWLVEGGRAVATRFDPAELGLPAATMADLRGGDPARNAEVIREVLAGKTGAIRDTVLLNAAAAVAAHDGLGLGDADGEQAARLFTERVAAELPAVAESIDSGAALETLDRLLRACAG